MPSFRRISDAGDLTGKVALVRVDFNVPMENGAVTDDTRLRAAVGTVQSLREKGAKVALLSHFGRPDGRRVESMSLAPVAEAFSAILGSPVAFAPDCRGEAVRQAIIALPPSGVILLENTRFYEGEEKGDAALAREIASLGDLYVNDAFSAAHRRHVSTAVLTELLPAYAGLNMEAELEALDKALGRPKRPVMAIVGGAKISSKIELLSNLVQKVDRLAIGGGMANTFLFARGVGIGRSLCERDLSETAREIEAIAHQSGCEILLPEDVVLAREFRADAPSRVASLDDVGEDEMILDAGPASIRNLTEAIRASTTLIWNGPLGAFEMRPFDTATVETARFAGRCASQGSLIAVAGGGDTVAALNHARAAGDFSFVSTAGGAFLEWMEGKELPGVAALLR
jgi:phosphoglycerate kinase